MSGRGVKPYEIEVVEHDDYRYSSLETLQEELLPELVEILVSRIREGLEKGTYVVIDGKVAATDKRDES